MVLRDVAARREARPPNTVTRTASHAAAPKLGMFPKRAAGRSTPGQKEKEIDDRGAEEWL